MYVFLTEQGSGTKVAVHQQQHHHQQQQKEDLRKEIKRKRDLTGAVAGGGVTVQQQQQVDSQDDLFDSARIALTIPPINLQQALKIINVKGFPKRHRSNFLLLLGIKYLENVNIKKAQQIYQMKQMDPKQKEILRKEIQRKRGIYGIYGDVAGGGGTAAGGVGNGKSSKKGT